MKSNKRLILVLSLAFVVPVVVAIFLFQKKPERAVTEELLPVDTSGPSHQYYLLVHTAGVVRSEGACRVMIQLRSGVIELHHVLPIHLDVFMLPPHFDFYPFCSKETLNSDLDEFFLDIFQEANKKALRFCPEKSCAEAKSIAQWLIDLKNDNKNEHYQTANGKYHRYFKPGRFEIFPKGTVKIPKGQKVQWLNPPIENPSISQKEMTVEVPFVTSPNK